MEDKEEESKPTIRFPASVPGYVVIAFAEN